MSVPSSAYDIKALSDTTTSKDYLFAKLLSEYGDWNGIKAKFYLDGVLEGNQDGITYFIGWVDPSGTNKDMHNSSRKGDLFNEIDLLLDAGLNCKPELPSFLTQSGQQTKINVLNNSILLRAFFKSSYYNSSTAHYIDISDSENLNIVVPSDSLGTINQNSSVTYSGEEFIISSSMIFYVGRTYVLILRTVNSEGERNSSTLSLSPAPGAVNLKFGSTLNAAIASTAASTVYVNRRITDAEDSSDGVVFYSNLEATGYVSTGYYLSIVADELGHYKYYRVTNSSGRVTEINSIVSRHQDVYYYYSAISEADAISGHSPSEIVLYYKVEITPPDSDFENRTYFNGTFVDSGYATQGYYVKEDRTTVLYVGANGAAEVLVG